MKGIYCVPATVSLLETGVPPLTLQARSVEVTSWIGLLLGGLRITLRGVSLGV